MGSNQMYKIKTSSNGRWTQNIKSRISHKPLVGTYSNLKLKQMGSNQSVQRYEIKKTSNLFVETV